MKKLLLKSLACGFLVGLLLFAIAPLGLGIVLIEQLKPVLVPGVYLAQFIVGNAAGSSLLLAVAVIFNGLLYSLLFARIFLLRILGTGSALFHRFQLFPARKQAFEFFLRLGELLQHLRRFIMRALVETFGQGFGFQRCYRLFRRVEISLFRFRSLVSLARYPFGRPYYSAVPVCSRFTRSQSIS